MKIIKESFKVGKIEVNCPICKEPVLKATKLELEAGVRMDCKTCGFNGHLEDVYIYMHNKH